MRNRKIMLVTLLSLTMIYAELLAQKKGSASVSDVLEATSEMHLTGYLGGKLEESIANRILAQDVERLIEPFKVENRNETRMWQSEFWGKWFTSAVLAYKYHPSAQLKQVLDKAVKGLLATQTPDGYIGNYAVSHRLEQWDIWGRKYCMLGLLSYYDLTKDEKSLVGASRIADNLINDLNKKDGIIVTKGNYKGMAASSVLEPICLLYNYTGNKKYLEFAERIVQQWETPEGPQLLSKADKNVSERFPKPKNWYSPEQGQKAYEMMSCYEGLLELYRITGNNDYLKAVKDTWENIRNTEINIVGSGASTEMWFGGKAKQNIPVHHYQETCVTVTWIKLTEQLLKLTGEVKYSDEVELSYYNALLGSLSSHGAVWAKYTPLNGQRLSGSEQCGMGMNCCEASGPRGLFNLPMHIIMKSKDGIQVNYFAAGTYKLHAPKKQVITLNQQTEYPKNGKVELKISVTKPEDMEVSIRIPNWSKETKVSVNNELITCLPGSNVKIKRVWKTGDKISLELDMRGRIIETGTDMHSAAIMYGPIVLARDSRFEGAGIESVMKPVLSKPGFVTLTALPANSGDDYLRFKADFIPESYAEDAKGPLSLMLCDYASAGNNELKSYFKVWFPLLFNPRGN
ncbi:glycoside hydrolase family 127 protein [Pedobacter sp. ok626]|uniref:glycoside hydrolase family 127 protein n=1 Tax=Pedobacter sp. ok626 TaxID=1761882 RepID=UPI001A9F089F|nr:beta-L-arabinofuranosidase domain-containing protein [Pedobacter sp. ok626]